MLEEATILKPVDVLYCGKCSMPPEYCEYSPDYESHCVPWLKKHHPDLWQRLQELRGGALEKNTDVNGDEEVKKERPQAPWTTEERLTAFYQEYQPDKLGDIPTMMEKYAGKYDKLFLALVKKYGVEPDDPYYDGSDDDSDDDSLQEGMDNLAVGAKKRRGAKAKKSVAVETRVIIQKTVRNKRKAMTHIVGMETMPGIKLKDVSKACSKKFAGSSSVKDGLKGGKEIIIQGDHMEDAAHMLISKFKVPGECIFLDFDGEFVSFG